VTAVPLPERPPAAKIHQRRFYILCLLLAAALGLSGCVAVKPYQREYLADRIMDFSADQSEDGIERHWVETREGSSGGLGGSGGGCACN